MMDPDKDLEDWDRVMKGKKEIDKNDITLNEARDLKRLTEIKIKEAIDEFIDKTHVFIESIDFDRITTMDVTGKDRMICTEITLNIKL